MLLPQDGVANDPVTVLLEDLDWAADKDRLVFLVLYVPFHFYRSFRSGSIRPTDRITPARRELYKIDYTRLLAKRS